MSRTALALGAAVLMAGGTAVALHRDKSQGSRAPSERPTLALLTSLPLLFAEEFSIRGGGSPVLALLDERYDVQPIGVADAASLAGKRLLLMAHPRAQPAEVLVELDQWVRAGGRVVLLADPKLEFDSAHELGDRLRPPLYFADTGLLGHWGLTIDGPEPTDTATAGRLTATRATCRVSRGALVARCKVGKGRATVIADADFVIDAAGTPAAPLALLIAELARIEPR